MRKNEPQIKFPSPKKVPKCDVFTAQLFYEIHVAEISIGGFQFQLYVTVIIIIIIIIMSHGHGPLRPNTKLLQTSRFCVIFTASPILRPVHSVMLSNHRFGRLPRHRTPSIEPNSTLFNSRLSGMWQICSNSVSFLCRMVLMIVFCLFSCCSHYSKISCFRGI